MTDVQPAPQTAPAQGEPDSRMLALTHWVTANTPGSWHPITLKSLGSDAGFRRYFRFQQGDGKQDDGEQRLRWLAVDAPPATEDSHQFIAVANLIRARGLHGPLILAADPQQGFLLVEDMGDNLLFRILDDTNADQLYRQAIDALLQLHACRDTPETLPPYDRALLRRELDIFKEWFVERLLNYNINDEERALLDLTFNLLEDTALNQPQAFVHRDYHSRNLILRDDHQLGIIDFQGALRGGITYDLVSLLRDCYLRWPPEKVIQWARYYRERAIALQQIPAVDEPVFLQWFDWLGLQRHIKVLGIFARLHLRDGKPGYLPDLPLVIRYTLETANQYTQLQPFGEWLHTTLLPIAQQQSWYSDYRRAGERE